MSKTPQGFQAVTVKGADGAPINPGDHIVACSNNGVLNWGIYVGRQHIPAVRNAHGYTTKREVRRFYYREIDAQGQPGKRRYINAWARDESDRMIRR